LPEMSPSVPTRHAGAGGNPVISPRATRPPCCALHLLAMPSLPPRLFRSLRRTSLHRRQSPASPRGNDPAAPDPAYQPQHKDVRMRLAALVLSLTLLSACVTEPVEEPSFSIRFDEGDFEIRDYAAIINAETTVRGNAWDARFGGFG